MSKEPAIYLQHILESIELIEKRVENISHNEFVKNVDLQDMVVRRLEIIGEAVRKLPKEFRERYTEIDWQDPAEMRSALIHGYFDVDMDIVWDTIKKDLPLFKNKVKKIIGVLEK